MKKLALITTLIVSTNALSHSMSPVLFGGKDDPLNSISLTGYVVVPISVGSSTGKDFVITVDDEEVDKVYVSAGSKVRASIPVNLNEPNKVETHHVCSIGMGTTFNTKICTKVKAYWLKKES